jgi:hypothetical protein
MITVSKLQLWSLHNYSSSFNLICIPVEHQKVGTHGQSKLKLLVPSIGTFFTRLPLADAFRYQDRKRFISSRRFVPPSFNDIRLILNTAQLMGVTAAGQLDLATFDGDVTLLVTALASEKPGTDFCIVMMMGRAWNRQIR